MQANEQGRTAQVVAWAWVVAVHAGLFWLLGLHVRSGDTPSDDPRMRLAFIERANPPAPAVLAPPTALRTRPARHEPSPVAATAPEAVKPLAEPAAMATAEVLAEQGREWTRQQAPLPSFASDPLRNRRSRLPGGDRSATFRMRDPLTPARVVGFIGTLFGGGPGSPCPRIRNRIPDLLTATSAPERELLQEELRRDREYCRP